MGSVFGRKAVPGAVKAEINNRGTKAGLLWNAKRFPWIRVTSLSSGCAGDYLVLGEASKPLYENNYVRPKPVVTQVQVKKQGELGTTKKATIDIIAFSDEQLVEMQKCFFLPGMGIRVQWGWNVDSFGNQAEPLVFGRNESNPKAICKMNSHAASHTNYNGLQGIVGNFGYKLTANNTWECNIEIIAASEAVAGSSVATHNCPQCARKYENEENGEKKEAVENKSDLYTFFHDLFENYETAAPKYKAAFGGGTIVQGNYMGVTRDDKGGDDSSWFEGGIVGSLIGNEPDATEAYISFATLEKAINTLCLPTKGGKHTVGKIQSKNTYITYHPSLESTDPRVCVIPGTPYSDRIVQLKSGWYTESAIVTGDGKERVLLDNILINAVFLMLEIDSVEKSGDAKLTTFLQNVLSKINAACGDLWEFEVVSNEENCADKDEVPVVAIIDTKVYDPAPPFEVPALAIGDKASVVRDITLNMKMNENMKTQAIYAGGTKSTAKTDAGGNCGANAFEAFGLGSNLYNLAAPPPSDTKDCPCEGAAPNEEKKSFEELMRDMADEVTDSSTSAARTALMDKYNPENGDQHCDGMIVPFEFSFTTDGIGGFSFGQMVTSYRVPDSVRNAYEWQVTAVEHTVTPNDWTTTVNTVMRYKKR